MSPAGRRAARRPAGPRTAMVAYEIVRATATDRSFIEIAALGSSTGHPLLCPSYGNPLVYQKRCAGMRVSRERRQASTIIVNPATQNYNMQSRERRQAGVAAGGPQRWRARVAALDGTRGPCTIRPDRAGLVGRGLCGERAGGPLSPNLPHRRISPRLSQAG